MAIAPVGDTTRRVRKIGLVLTILALLTVAASFAVITGMTRIVPTDAVLGITAAINLALLAGLGGLIAWEFVGLWLAWRAGRAAARARSTASWSICSVPCPPMRKGRSSMPPMLASPICRASCPRPSARRS